MNVLGITPFSGEYAGSIDVPGSKSISNRALILSVLCDT
jgi:5-enolpyruvylshikimate-3-phosphate synthase